ncbi:MAG TPA: type II secretion system F family protein [Stellaceae bacterium]|jgi:general secretion pathway protein F
MPRFHYRALTVAGELVSGEIDGSDRAAIIARLNDQTLLPIDAVETRAPRTGLSVRLAGPRAIGARDLAVLSQQLARLLRAGLPLDRALEILASLAADRRGAELVRQLLAQVRDGASLAAAMAARRRSFPASYVSMVRAGEESAALPAVLGRLADFLARAETNRQRVASALIYPAILVVVAALSVMLVLTVVLPQFAPLFAEAGARLPESARVLLAIGDGLGAFWWAILLALAATAFGMRQALSVPRIAAARDRFILAMPIAGPLARRFEIGRFARTLSVLLTNGVAAPRALALSGAAITNRVIAGAVETVAARFKEGEGLSAPLARSGEFPALAIQLIRTGEETGRLDDMLNEVAETFEEEAERTVERLIALLVPAITIAMGLVIAAIIATVMTAMISINDLAV